MIALHMCGEYEAKEVVGSRGTFIGCRLTPVVPRLFKSFDVSCVYHVMTAHGLRWPSAPHRKQALLFDDGEGPVMDRITRHPATRHVTFHLVRSHTNSLGDTERLPCTLDRRKGLSEGGWAGLGRSSTRDSSGARLKAPLAADFACWCCVIYVPPSLRAAYGRGRV